MSALDELKEIEKSHRLDLDWAVIDYDTERAAAELLALRSDLADAKARAKTAEENWHKNEARIAKLETEKDAYLEFYKANADAWKEYAKHQEYCAVCAENVDDCETGAALRSVADVSFEDVISL